jgi:type II secretory pathway component GspD/PulD (secretin)
MSGKRLRYRGYRKLCVLLVTYLLLCAGWTLAAGTANGGDTPTTQYKIFALKHISAEQGKKYLAEANIGTVSQLPGANAILVTATPKSLAKAAAIIKLVDAQEKFVIKAVLPVSEAQNLPSNDDIAAAVGGGISIGSFSNPPEEKAAAKAIIDVHNNSVVVIAPVGLLEKIVSVLSTIEQPSEKTTEAPIVEPSEANEPNAVATAPEKKTKVAEPKTTRAAKPIVISPYEPEPLVNADDVLKLDLPEKIDIVQLLGLVGQYLNLDYMYDATQVKGEVTLQLHGKLKGAVRVKDLYPLLESVLKFRGFAMTRKTNLVTIVPVTQVLDIDPTLQTDRRKIDYGDAVITCGFQLKHIDTTSAMNLLTNMKLGTAVTPIPDTSMLIVTEYTYRMGRIQELLEMIDKPGEPKRFKFRQLKYTMAKTLAPKVKALAEQLGTMSITIAATQAMPTAVLPGMPPVRTPAVPTPAISRPVLPGAPTTGAQPTVYLDADERTNRILMIGIESQLTVVDGLVEALDVAQQDLRAMKLYKVEFVDADEVKKKLQELGIIGRTVETPSRITGTVRTPAGTPETGQPTQPTLPATRTAPVTTGAVTETLVEEPQVIVLEPTNSLLVNATAEQHAQIAGVIKYVDSETEKRTIPYIVYPLENQDPDGLAEVLNKLIQETIKDKEGKIEKVVKKTEEEIMIVPDKKTFSIIVYASKKNQEWIGTLIKKLDEYRPQVLLDVTLVEITKNEKFTSDLDLVTKFPKLEPGGTMSGVGPSAKLSPFPAKTIAEAASTAGAGGKAFFADQHIQALLELMQEKGYGRVLAKPKLLVNDNEEGTIKSEEKTSVVREQTQIIPGTATTTPTYTTSVGFEGFTAGITLTITPHISKGEQVQLKITLNRTDFRLREDYAITSGTETLKGPTPPDILSSDVTTKVTVPNGTTIILGGLERLKQNKGGTKVPVLGDVPLVGALFRSTSNTDDQSRLYVFVKAHVLRPGEEAVKQSDIEVISRKNRDRFERYEEEMQRYNDWPGIRPKPMDPAKILEEN